MGRFIGKQERDHVRNGFRLTHAIHRTGNRLQDTRIPILGKRNIQHGCLDAPRCHGIDPDLSITELLGERTRQLDDPALRGAVGRVIGKAHQASQRSHIHHGPALFG